VRETRKLAADAIASQAIKSGIRLPDYRGRSFPDQSRSNRSVQVTPKLKRRDTKKYGSVPT
jgi:hypothetical protein